MKGSYYDPKSVYMVSQIEKIINKYNENIASKKLPYPNELCPKCYERPNSYKLHELSPRFFQFIKNKMVHTINSFLPRWKCNLCNASFIVYPPFALPYKRYILLDFKILSEEYLNKEQKTYRDVVKVDYAKTEIFYKGNGIDIDDRCLSHTTLWRYVGFLGSLNNILSNALDLIRQKDPESSIFREFVPVFVCKYRSKARKLVLETAQKLIFAQKEFIKLFKISIFPQFGTEKDYG